MKVCHILPPKVLPAVEDLLDDQHLLLPALMPIQSYNQFYRGHSGVDWLTLDNGVAEGKMSSFAHLMAMARLANVQEVVLPDVMGDSDNTLDLLLRTVYEAYTYRKQFRFMFVPQGKSLKEIVHCAEQAMNMCPGIISAFGIPRHILGTGENDIVRVWIAQELRARFLNDIHLLGTHPNRPFELKNWGQEFQRMCRSVDTSLAWNATLQGIRLSGTESLNYNLSIARQPIVEFAIAGFDHADHRYIDLLRDNIKEINSWVK